MTEFLTRSKDVLRSTPLRLAIALVILFAFVSLTSLGASYLFIRDSMDQSMRSDLRQGLAGFKAAPSAAAVAALVNAEAAATDPKRRVLSYIAVDGRHFGNGILARTEDGFRIIAKPDSEELSDSPYLMLSSQLYGGQLSIAISRSQIGDLAELFASILLLSLLPTTAIALTAGLIIARRSARRIDAVSATLDKLTDGDLSARVGEMPGRLDDLSSIGAQVNRMAKAQQASVEALKQVSTDIAHDLKTPIQRVSVLLNRARELPLLPPELEELVASAGRETDGIVATFQSLLQIAQIEGGSPRARFKPVDLGALAATFVEVYEPAAEESGHALTLASVPPGSGLVLGDKALLGQVLANLIENALRHTPTGCRIDISLKQVGSAVVLSVADDGPGIPKNQRGKVLRRLYRLEQSRTTPGNGLGLSLVAVIAELHDATLELSGSEPGLIVRLRFPTVPEVEIHPVSGS